MPLAFLIESARERKDCAEEQKAIREQPRKNKNRIIIDFRVGVWPR
jgi:hypothetical protein